MSGVSRKDVFNPNVLAALRKYGFGFVISYIEELEARLDESDAADVYTGFNVGETIEFARNYCGDTPGQVVVPRGTVAEVTEVDEASYRVKIKNDAGWWDQGWFRRHRGD